MTAAGAADGARAGVGVDVRAGVAAAAGDEAPLVWLPLLLLVVVVVLVVPGCSWEEKRRLGLYFKTTMREGGGLRLEISEERLGRQEGSIGGSQAILND